MTPEQLKLSAAMNVVENSVLHGWNTDAYIKYVKLLLPDHYTVKESNKKGSVHCVSSIVIIDDESWDYFVLSVKDRIGENFQEIFHNTCWNHSNFTIYIKSNQK